jgi:hypothetical protein
MKNTNDVNCNEKNDNAKKEMNEYLEQLDEKERLAYKIAMEHLGTSFNILRSNGYSEWKKNKK